MGQQNTLSEEIKTTVNSLAVIEKELNSYYVEREEEIHGLSLAITANTNILLLGEPGVGKSDLVVDFSRHITDAKYFEWLMGQFSTPDEIFGTYSIESLREGKFERHTEGMLSESHIAFLDEFWKCNNGVINSLLPVMNERKFHNHGKVHPVPLLLMVGASNELPQESDHLDAALDRFVLKYYVDTVRERSNMLKMMDNYLNREDKKITTVSLEELKRLQTEVKKVDVPLGVRQTLYDIYKKLESLDITVSPRVINQCLRISQAQAILCGRTEVKEEDLEVLRHALWKNWEHEKTISKEILTLISPETEELEENITEARRIYHDFKEELSKESEGGTEANYIHFATNLGSLKKKVEKVRKNLSKKGKSTKTADKYLNLIVGYINEVMIDGLNSDIKIK